MGRDRQRATLDAGIGLDLNKMIKQGFVRPGSRTVSRGCWTDAYGDEIAATITADLSGARSGTFRITFEGYCQEFILESRGRNFGGRQWYWHCPKSRRLCSTLWMPAGANYFASRRAWGRQFAYSSQFLDRTNRAHHGQAKINRRLCRIGGLDSAEWSFPPKPKWMRWRTYNAVEAKYDQYEEILDSGTIALVRKFVARTSR